jgi:hypothetical protein
MSQAAQTTAFVFAGGGSLGGAPAPERGRFIDDAKPVKYPTLAEIRAELAARGLPPLRDILAIESEEDRTSEID